VRIEYRSEGEDVRMPLKSVTKWIGAVIGFAAGAYGMFVIGMWRRYGSPATASQEDEDTALDHFMPRYDVVERHRVRIQAPAAVTFAAAKEMDLFQHPVIRAIFKARELILGSAPDRQSRPRGIVDQTKALGWVVLQEDADREILMGAVTRPWEPNVVFRSIAPDAFAAFSEPGYVKIVWTLRADPARGSFSMFRTETRAVATDDEAGRLFRRYWSFLSPGIGLIRWLSLMPLKREAEGRAVSRRNSLTS
jgi:hypothetical protein